MAWTCSSQGGRRATQSRVGKATLHSHLCSAGLQRDLGTLSPTASLHTSRSDVQKAPEIAPELEARLGWNTAGPARRLSRFAAAPRLLPSPESSPRACLDPALSCPQCCTSSCTVLSLLHLVLHWVIQALSTAAERKQRPSDLQSTGHICSVYSPTLLKLP